MLVCISSDERNYAYKKSENGWKLSFFSLIELDDRFEIWKLKTREHNRRKGYAEMMLREFIEQFDFNKPLILYVYKTNKIAIHLYEKVGFKIIGDYPHGDYAYKMQYQGGKYENN